MKKKVAIYGAGAVALAVFKNLKEQFELTCFIDRDKNKYGFLLCGLPVMSLEQAMNSCPELHIYIALSDMNKFQVMDDLISEGMSTDKIVNYEPYKKYKSCPYLESRFGINSDALCICCCGYNMKKSPVIKYAKTPKETIDDFIATRDRVIEIISQDNVKGSDYPDIHCIGCPQVKENFWRIDRKFKDVCLTFFSKCNFDCAYCAINQFVKKDFEAKVSLEFMLECCNEAKKRGLIDKDSRISPVPTEICAFSKRNLLFEAFADYPCSWVSNASAFIPDLAESLSRGGKLVTSVDAGTRETFKQVRGADLFERVSENLVQYSEYGSVVLKYIFLKGYNINYKDVDGFFELCKKCKNCSVEINRDMEDSGGHEGRTSLTATEKKKGKDFTEEELKIIAHLYRKLVESKICVTILRHYFNDNEWAILNKYIQA